ncbi:MAG: acetoacetate--CoA ligase [bacterium]
MSEILWKPDPVFVQSTNMTAFSNYLTQKTKLPFPDYASLHQWSVENIEVFWEYFLEYTSIIYRQPHQQVLNTQNMPEARWFSGMKLNFTENILGRNFQGPAIIYQIEPSDEEVGEGDRYSGCIDFDELKIQVAKCASALKQSGVQTGDRVAGYLANVPEAIIACLACASIGATWSSASPDFGLTALCDRMQQIQPKLIFASTHYRYGGKTFHTDAVVKELPRKIPSLEKIVSVPYPVGPANVDGDVTWQAFLSEADTSEIKFEPVSFEHPLFILFSSGTTGAPKCMVHGTGGTLMQHRKEHQLHCNLTKDDTLFYFTTCGWMMWNWQLSALSLGTTIVLYDGNPGYPDLSAIWRFVDKTGITHFGTSGRFIESCMKSKAAFTAKQIGELSSLKSVLYTGSPLSANGFRWIYDTIKKEVHLAGISGGTDIVSCFILGNPNLPVVAGEIQCKGLAVDVEAYDARGKIVVNQPGELVCRKPLPSMPIQFLNDPDGKKYRKAYFEDYPGVWRHGDYVQFTPDGGAIVLGRSDSTLNPGGVRIGSAEIYSAIEPIPNLLGAVVVGWTPPNQSDEVIVLLVVLSKSLTINEAIRKMLRQTIREKCSPRHVPKHIFQISEIPITRSGKTVELSVKAILAGKNVANRNALANPQVLEEIDQIRNRLLHLQQKSPQ